MILDDRGRDPILDDLDGRVLTQILARIRHISNCDEGPKALGSKPNHQLRGSIWQLWGTHPHRFPYFQDGPRAIVITHGFKKTGGARGNTPTHEIDKADAIRAKYLAGKANKTIDFEE